MYEEKRHIQLYKEYCTGEEHFRCSGSAGNFTAGTVRTPEKTEKELGMLLFDRSRQPLELTEAGRVYLEYIDEVLAAEKELMQSSRT